MPQRGAPFGGKRGANVTIFGRTGRGKRWPLPIVVPAGVIIAWPSTNASIPLGWTRVTALDSRYVKQIATSATNPGATGGAANHTHPYGSHSDHVPGGHTHTWPASGTHSPTGVNSGGVLAGRAHSHAMSQASTSSPSLGAGGPTDYDAATTEPQHLVVIFIKSNGSPSGVPANGLVWFNGAAPAGFTAYANADNRLLKGAATAGDGGGTGGTGNSHTHTSASHSHTVGTHEHTLSATADAGASSYVSGAGNQASAGHSHPNITSSADGSHTSGSTAESSAAGDMSPAWRKMRAVENTSGSPSMPSNVICMWDGTIASVPSSWKLCDGLNSTPNLSSGVYVRGATSNGEVDTTGGATTHTHAGAGHVHTSGSSHTHTQVALTASSGCVLTLQCASSAYAIAGHTHTAGAASCAVGTGALGSRSTTGTANTANDPLFTGIAYIQYPG